jgi:hypothetical protein
LVLFDVVLDETQGVLFAFGQHPSIIGNIQGKYNRLGT